MVIAIEQCRHWINESHYMMMAMPDNDPVVKAANKMLKGKASKSPRLQSLLACVNRNNV